MRSALSVVGAAKRFRRYSLADSVDSRCLCDSSLDNARSRRRSKAAKHNAGGGVDVLGQICSVLSSAGVGNSPRKRRPQREFDRSQLLSSSSSSGDTRADARLILDVLQSRADAVELKQVLDRYSFRLSDDLVARVILGAGNVETVRSFFDWACNQENYRPNTLAYDALLQVLVKNGKMDAAMDTFRHLAVESLAPNCFTYGVLLEGLASARSVAEALEIFDSVKEMGEDAVRTCSIFLIRGLCKDGNVPVAVSQYLELRDNLRLEVSVYNSLISGLVENRMVDQALEVRKQMDEDYCKPNEQTYKALVSGLSQADRVDEACRLLIEMSSKGYVPEPATYIAAIDGLCKSRQFGRACALVELMEAPDIVTYSALLDNLCNAGKMDIAFELVDQILDRGNKPDAIFYSILVKGLCKVKQVDNAITLMEKMAEKGCLPTTATYNTIIQGLIGERRLVEARHFFDEMIRRGCEPNAATYVIICEGFIKKDITGLARQLVEGSKEEDDIVAVASRISSINNLCEQGDMEEACRAFNSLSQSLSKPPVAAFSKMVRGFLKEGNFIQADRMVQDMLARGSVPDHHFQDCVASGLYHLARTGQNELFEAVLEMINHQQWIPHPLFCSCLVEGLCIAGLLDFAYQLVLAVNKKTRLANEHMWEVLIRRLAHFGNATHALEALKKAVERGCQLHSASYQDVIHALLKAGMVQQAAEQFKALLQLECSSWHLLIIHDSLMIKLCSVDVNKAYSCLQEVVRRGLSPNVRTYNQLMKSFCKSGMHEQARELFRQMKAVNSTPNNASYSILMDEYVRAGMLDEAVSLFQEMVDLDFQPFYHTYNELVKSLCKAWRVDEAHRILQQLMRKEREPPLVSFEAVFQAYYEASRFDKAREVFEEMSREFRLTSTCPLDFHLDTEQLRRIYEFRAS